MEHHGTIWNKKQLRAEVRAANPPPRVTGSCRKLQEAAGSCRKLQKAAGSCRSSVLTAVWPSLPKPWCCGHNFGDSMGLSCRSDTGTNGKKCRDGAKDCWVRCVRKASPTRRRVLGSSTSRTCALLRHAPACCMGIAETGASDIHSHGGLRAMQTVIKRHQVNP